MKKTITLFALILITGCSHIYGDQGVIRNRDTAYLKAQSLPPLNIPPGMSSSTIEAHYPVAGHNYPTSTQKIGLVPPDLNPGK